MERGVRSDMVGMECLDNNAHGKSNPNGDLRAQPSHHYTSRRSTWRMEEQQKRGGGMVSISKGIPEHVYVCPMHYKDEEREFPAYDP
ncbi:hypothetical protein E2C01_076976 [Portunus trituberculatus]|uniref:Uncharacterized protein n=1 Tax=Portunus trituberculatus TaxID=210409 RepID=A0A5B7INC5_PORTR|nr:hypothetical protein [Portunus trituberculatus]